MNRRLMLKRMQMHPGIQEPRERTEWWRDNPYLRIVPADIDHSKFYSQIVPVNEVQRRKEEKRTCSCPAGTALALPLRESPTGITMFGFCSLCLPCTCTGIIRVLSLLQRYCWDNLWYHPTYPGLHSLPPSSPLCAGIIRGQVVISVIVGIAPLNSWIHPPSASA